MLKKILLCTTFVLLAACGPVDDPGPEDPQVDNCEADCKELDSPEYPYDKCLSECRP